MTADERRSRRSERIASADPVTRGILDVIAKFDDAPGTSALLREAVRAAPARFRAPGVVESLFELAEAADWQRSPVALAILNALDTDGERLLRIALESFAQGRGSVEAGRVVIARLTEAHADALRSAVPGLASLATPLSLGIPVGGPPSDVRPLQVACSKLPEVVTSSLASMLRTGDRYRRRVAAQSAAVLFEYGPLREAPDGLVEELLRSVVCDSGTFFESRSDSPSAAAADALGAAMKRDPEKVDARIHRHMYLGTEHDQAVLLDAYLHVLERQPTRTPPPVSAAERTAFARMMAVLHERRPGPAFDRAVEFLRYPAFHYPDLVADRADALVGMAALITDDIARVRSGAGEPKDRIDPTVALARHYEAETLIITLRGARTAVVEVVGSAAAHRPTEVLPNLLRAMAELREDQRELYVALLDAVGIAGTRREGLPLVLPTLYSALVHRSSEVRVAGAQAYGKLAQAAAGDVPNLLHQTFLVLLTDRNVAVHAAAMDALRNVDLPAALQSLVVERLGYLILSYSGDPINDEVWGTAIERYFGFLEGTGVLVPTSGDAVLRLVPRMNPGTASRTLRRLGWRVRDFAAFPDVVVQVLSDPRVDGNEVEDLLDELQRLSPEQLVRIAPKIRDAGLAELAKGRAYLGESFTELLVRAQAWSGAAAVAEETLAGTRFPEAHDPGLDRLHAEARLIAVRMEEAIAAGQLDRLGELTARWVRLSTGSKQP